MHNINCAIGLTFLQKVVDDQNAHSAHISAVFRPSTYFIMKNKDYLCHHRMLRSFKATNPEA